MQIYADNAATTKMSKKAIEAMLPYMDGIYGNRCRLQKAWHTFTSSSQGLL